MKSINVANVVRYIASGNMDVVRRLRDAVEAKLRRCKVDPATVAAGKLPPTSATEAVTYNEGGVLAYVADVGRRDADGIKALKTILSACRARGL